MQKKTQNIFTKNFYLIKQERFLHSFALKVNFSAGLGTWPFCGQIVKIWPFLEVVWPQIFCLTFWLFLSIFENLAEFRLMCMWYHILEFKHSKCLHVHPHKHASLSDS